MSSEPRRARLAAALLVSLCAACASSRLTQEPGLVPSWDRRHPADVPHVDVVLHARQLRFDVPVGTYFAPRWSRRSTAKQLDRVLAEFPFLQPAAAGATPYRLAIEATHATGGSKRWSKVGKMSNYLIPCVEETAVELEGRLLRDGQVVKTYEAVGTYKTKRHLLFLLWPLTWKNRAPGATTADTFRDLFLQVERDAAAWRATAQAVP
jgi:hypothetical protein